MRTLAVAAVDCAGLSLYGAELSCVQAAGESKKKRKRGQRAHRSAFLFTHRGYSGPSVLDLSHSITMALERGTAAPGEKLRQASLSSFGSQLKTNMGTYGPRRAILSKIEHRNLWCKGVPACCQ